MQDNNGMTKGKNVHPDMLVGYSNTSDISLHQYHLSLQVEKVVQIHEECLISDGFILNGGQHISLIKTNKNNESSSHLTQGIDDNKPTKRNTLDIQLAQFQDHTLKKATSRVASFIKQHVARFGFWLDLTDIHQRTCSAKNAE